MSAFSFGYTQRRNPMLVAITTKTMLLRRYWGLQRTCEVQLIDCGQASGDEIRKAIEQVRTDPVAAMAGAFPPPEPQAA